MGNLRRGHGIRASGRHGWRPSALGCAALLAGMAPPCFGAGPPADQPATCQPQRLAGVYNAHQMETAAAIELLPSGRFRYQLAYGALDEAASGKWDCDGGAVVLTSDRVDPPRFVLVQASAAPKGQLRIVLDVPAGISRQNFAVLVKRAAGSALYNMSEDGLTIPLAPGVKVLAVVPLLPVYELSGEAIPVPTGEGTLRLRFDANDLGKVAFDHTALRLDGGALVLERHGETITFTRDAQR
jgi:hypothetical protein